VGKPGGKGRLEWPRRIEMNIGEVGWGIMDWNHLAQDRDQLEGSCEHNNETSGSIKCCETLQ
jgi:hypothetical protein